MQRPRYYYLIQLQYLGFRYHGWQKQPGLKTVHRMVDRTIAYVLGRKNFKVIAAGRTDARVSVNQTYVELFLEEAPLEINKFFPLLNKNLPQDIRALKMTQTDADFNIIQHPKKKEYLYFFSFGEKFHPFCAALMTNINDSLDIELMQKGAKCFEGAHDFWSYTYQPKPQTQTRGVIQTCEIEENELYRANFFPKKSYVMRVEAAGFKRHQIRLMMGALFDLGSGKIDLAFLKKNLEDSRQVKCNHVAPASGLILNAVDLEEPHQKDENHIE